MLQLLSGDCQRGSGTRAQVAVRYHASGARIAGGRSSSPARGLEATLAGWPVGGQLGNICPIFTRLFRTLPVQFARRDPLESVPAPYVFQPSLRLGVDQNSRNEKRILHSQLDPVQNKLRCTLSTRNHGVDKIEK